LDLHRGATLLALTVDRLFDLARAQVAGDVNVALQAGREFGERIEAGDAMPIGVRLLLALGDSCLNWPRPPGVNRGIRTVCPFNDQVFQTSQR